MFARKYFFGPAMPCLWMWLACGYLYEQPAKGQTQGVFFEGFDDDFCAGRNIPNLVDPGLSSQFSAVNAPRPDAVYRLTLRNRDVLWSPGGLLFSSVILDFTDGGGIFVTFKFDVGSGHTITGGTVAFDVVNYGDDDNLLHKFVSGDGANFTAVGDGSNSSGTHVFAAATGFRQTFLQIQEDGGGVHIDNVRAVLCVDGACPAGVFCGNGSCEGGENSCTCPADCPGVCGDGVCIPTLSEWGIVAMAALMLAAGAVVMSRRRAVG